MSSLSERPSLATPRASATRRLNLTADELIRQRVRRRLLRYILETHRRRVAERGLGPLWPSGEQ